MSITSSEKVIHFLMVSGTSSAIPSVRTSSATKPVPEVTPSVWMPASVAEISKPTLRLPLMKVLRILLMIGSFSHAVRILPSTRVGTATVPLVAFSVSRLLHSASSPVLRNSAYAFMYSLLFLISSKVGIFLSSCAIVSIVTPAPSATAFLISAFCASTAFLASNSSLIERTSDSSASRSAPSASSSTAICALRASSSSMVMVLKSMVTPP